MERIMRPKDVAEHYKCSVQTARKYMRKMEHMEHPLTVYESDVVRWDILRREEPGNLRRKMPKTKKPPVTVGPSGKKFIIPRVRG